MIKIKDQDQGLKSNQVLTLFGNIPFENASVLPGSESENILLCPSDRRGFGEVIVVPQAHSINAASFLSDRPR